MKIKHYVLAFAAISAIVAAYCQNLYCQEVPADDRTSTSAEKQLLEELTYRYYKDIETNDPEDQRLLFSPNSTDGSANPRPYAFSEDRRIEKFEIHRVEIGDGIANVWITVRCNGTLKKTGKPVGGWWNRDFPATHRFVKEGDTWLTMEIVATSEELAAEMWQERTKEDMEKVLARYPFIVDKQSLLDLSGVGYDFSVTGDDLPRAIVMLKLVLRRSEELGEPEAIAYACQFLGSAYSRKGDYGPALVYYQRYYTILESLDDSGLGNALNSFAVIYSELGDTPRFLEYLEKSYKYYQKTGEGGGGVLGNIGNAYLDLSRYEEARTTFEKVLATGIETKREDLIRRGYLGLARLDLKLGDYASALKQCDLVLLHNTDRSARYTEGAISQLKSEIYLGLGNYQEASRHAKLALIIAEELKLRSSMWELTLLNGLIYSRLGYADNARTAFESSVAAVEELKQNSLGTEYSQQQFFANKAAPYREYSVFLASQGAAEGSFALAERGKAGVLLSALTESPNHARKLMTEEERVRETELTEKVIKAGLRVRWLIQVSGGTRELVSEALQNQETAREELETFRIGVNAAHPELTALRRTTAAITPEESGLIISDSTLALEFVMGKDNGAIVSIRGGRVPSKSSRIEAAKIPVGEEKLGSLIDNYRRALAAGDLGFRRASRELYDLLIKPFEKELAGKTNIIIVPDGPLWDLPFQALQDEKGRYLIEKAAISYAPSLTALREMSKRASARPKTSDYELVAFGNPIIGKETAERVQRVFMSEKLDPLPEAERLVTELGKLYGKDRSRVFVRGEARESVAKSEIPKYRVVQFATHGILNNISPMYSHLVMAQNTKDPNEDGLLEAWELKDLDLNADLVILSACETARGKISGGEGVIGMSWAAFIAGAPSIVASQWKVESSSTTELMLEFHRQLLSKKKPTKAEALRQASLKLMKSKEYSHPSYWAGFVLVGDGN